MYKFNVFKKYYCELNDNCVHLLVEIVDICMNFRILHISIDTCLPTFYMAPNIQCLFFRVPQDVVKKMNM